MQVLVFIMIVIVFILILQGIKKLNANIESDYKIDVNDMKSIIVLFISVLIAFMAHAMRKEWSTDNILILTIIAIGIFVFRLYKNIKRTNVLYGIWITFYQIIVGILIVAFIILILKALFPDEETNKKIRLKVLL